jgi:hypothetical protein
MAEMVLLPAAAVVAKAALVRMPFQLLEEMAEQETTLLALGRQRHLPGTMVIMLLVAGVLAVQLVVQLRMAVVAMALLLVLDLMLKATQAEAEAEAVLSQARSLALVAMALLVS